MDSKKLSPELLKVFDQQVQNLIEKDIYKKLGLGKSGFLKIVEKLKMRLLDVPVVDVDIDKGSIPFVIAINSLKVDVNELIPLIDHKGKNAVVSLYPRNVDEFQTIESVTIPTAPFYLLTEVDRGSETLNTRPKDALHKILAEERSPLTISEGVQIMLHYPEFLKKNNCFSLLGSRFSDKRVPAIWISDGRPKLGWCWEGNPHTWLGSASCKERVGG